MKTFDLCGILEERSKDSFYIPVLKQEDGYCLDLLSRLWEIGMSYATRKLHLRYWVSDVPQTKDTLQEMWIMHILGNDISSGMDKREIRYSEWTSDIEYNISCQIGQHDFYNEVCRHMGDFIWLEITIEEDLLEEEFV